MIKKVLKRVSALLQGPRESFNKHHSEYLEEGKLERERSMAQKYERDGEFNSPGNKLGKLLQQYPLVRETAVDIGSGSGWLSAKLSEDFKKVCAIEPSSKAVEIAKALYPQNDYPNITWTVGFAEDVLPSVRLQAPALFVTGVVLSHLRDKEVLKICLWLNSRAPAGSILSFNECWGQESHRLRWHVRTGAWWRQQLSNWAIDFHGPEFPRDNTYHMGLHAVKVK